MAKTRQTARKKVGLRGAPIFDPEWTQIIRNHDHEAGPSHVRSPTPEEPEPKRARFEYMTDEEEDLTAYPYVPPEAEEDNPSEEESDPEEDPEEEVPEELPNEVEEEEEPDYVPADYPTDDEIEEIDEDGEIINPPATSEIDQLRDRVEVAEDTVRMYARRNRQDERMMRQREWEERQREWERQQERRRHNDRSERLINIIKDLYKEKDQKTIEEEQEMDKTRDMFYVIREKIQDMTNGEGEIKSEKVLELLDMAEKLCLRKDPRNK